jgi:hypothetical protein
MLSFWLSLFLYFLLNHFMSLKLFRGDISLELFKILALHHIGQGGQKTPSIKRVLVPLGAHRNGKLPIPIDRSFI